MVNLLPVHVAEDSEAIVLVNQQEIPPSVTLKAAPDGTYVVEGDQQVIADLLRGRRFITSSDVRNCAPEAFEP